MNNQQVGVARPQYKTNIQLSEYPKGPSALVLQSDRGGRPIHVVWGIPRGESSPAVLVTAYRPDPDRWTDDFQRRKK